MDNPESNTAIKTQPPPLQPPPPPQAIGQFKGRPLSISSISSAASSGSNFSTNSSTSSGVHSSSLTRNSSLNYGAECGKHAYLTSIESLNSSRTGSDVQTMEADLKSLNLSPTCQFKDSAAARAAILAAGAESRGFNTPGSRISKINRSFHASLRYDKNTAQRIHAMANARASMDTPRTTSTNNSDISDQQRRGGSVSRNNSSTSSDSGHHSARFVCPCDYSNPSITSSSSSSQVEQRELAQRVVTEIIETERAYVDDLEQIVTGYICYLRGVLRQQKQQQQSQLSLNISKKTQQQQHQHPSIDGNIIIPEGIEDDEKPMLISDDETTSATNELEDYEVEENDHDTLIKETMITHDLNEHSNNISTKEDEAIINSTQIKRLFSNLEDIYKFNKDLLFRLEECYLNPSSVAECFVENAAGFEVYTHYCTMYPEVVSTLTELMANRSSAQLLRERQTELKQGLPLGAYLLKPVQRILKYHILFQRLIKYCSEEESVSEKDCQLISEAFSVMTSIACHINAMKRRHEHAIRVQEIQGLLSDWEGPDLTTLGELIMEETFKLFNRPKSTRHLFLFDNVLLMTKKKHDGSLCYKGHIACSNLMLIENIEGQPLVFNTVPFDNPKALCAFQARTLDKKRDWCIQIKEVIIKSFEVKIPGHVKDILMGLTNSASTDSNTKSSETSRALRAPNYLERKRSKQHDKKK